MIRLIKSITNRQSSDDYEFLEKALYSEKAPLLSDQEKEGITFLIDTFKRTGEFVTESFFCESVPLLSFSVESAQPVPDTDFALYLKNLFHDRTIKRLSTDIMSIASDVQKTKEFSDENYDKVRELYSIARTSDTDEEQELGMGNIRETYELMKSKPMGLLTFVREIDEKIGGLSEGTLNLIFGYTSHFKTTWALNIAYKSAYDLGYNVAYISLEVPKSSIWYNVLSRHSFSPKFPKYPFIGHDKIRKGLLSQEEEDYLFDVIEPDYKQNSKGLLEVFDETDFRNNTIYEYREALEALDERLYRETGSGLDAVFWDHANLFKFGGSSTRSMSQGDIINTYLSFIRQLSIRFVKREGAWKGLCNVVLMQANREGFKRALKANGRYDLRAISEANEAERASHRIMYVYTSENLKAAKEAQVGLLKDRSGATQTDPVSVFVDPEAYVFGEDVQGFMDMPSASAFDSLLSGGDLMGF